MSSVCAMFSPACSSAVVLVVGDPLAAVNRLPRKAAWRPLYCAPTAAASQDAHRLSVGSAGKKNRRDEAETSPRLKAIPLLPDAYCPAGAAGDAASADAPCGGLTRISKPVDVLSLPTWASSGTLS